MDNLAVILGRRGAGKSTLASQWAEWAALDGAAVIVHDPMRGFPEGGEPRAASMTGLRWYENAGRVVVLQQTIDFSELVTHCKQTARSHRNGCYLVLDEGVLLLGGVRPGVVKQQLREVAATARHIHLRVLIIAQAANLLDYQMLALADRLALFAMTDAYNLSKVRAAGVPEEVCDKLAMLPDRQFYVGAPGRPPNEWKVCKTVQRTRAA